MKKTEKTIRKWLLLSAALFSLTATAQEYNLQIRMQDGTTKVWPTSGIKSIEFKQDAPPTFEGLTGRWMLVASPAGIDTDDGIGIATIDTVRFTATLADDAGSLHCHADTLCVKDGTAIAADWLVTAAEQDDKRRLGWVLSATTPVASYSQYLYFLSENIQTGRLEGMTLWSEWTSKEDNVFKFPQNQELYGVWSEQQPYQSANSYLEIWASPRFIKLP